MWQSVEDPFHYCEQIGSGRRAWVFVVSGPSMVGRGRVGGAANRKGSNGLASSVHSTNYWLNVQSVRLQTAD
jgi:hypothetical protein